MYDVQIWWHTLDRHPIELTALIYPYPRSRPFLCLTRHVVPAPLPVRLRALLHASEQIAQHVSLGTPLRVCCDRQTVTS